MFGVAGAGPAGLKLDGGFDCGFSVAIGVVVELQWGKGVGEGVEVATECRVWWWVVGREDGASFYGVW